jgi:hypothetical protein
MKRAVAIIIVVLLGLGMIGLYILPAFVSTTTSAPTTTP